MYDLYLFLGLFCIGYLFGKFNERKHYRSIIKREQSLISLPTTNSKHPIDSDAGYDHARLVSGNVVISVDYFKRILAGLRNLFGGTIQPYETLMDRARREAVLRLRESCQDASEIINLRIETSSISKGRGSSIGSVEILAYATALYKPLRT